MRSDTTQRQGSDDCDSWHSVGHLFAKELLKEIDIATSRAYLVQVPEARGKVIPDMASIRDDFPALCDPKTAMMGISRSNCTLREMKGHVELSG